MRWPPGAKPKTPDASRKVPHAQTRPSAARAHEWLSPAETCTKGPAPSGKETRPQE